MSNTNVEDVKTFQENFPRTNDTKVNVPFYKSRKFLIPLASLFVVGAIACGVLFAMNDKLFTKKQPGEETSDDVEGDEWIGNGTLSLIPTLTLRVEEFASRKIDDKHIPETATTTELPLGMLSETAKERTSRLDADCEAEVKEGKNAFPSPNPVSVALRDGAHCEKLGSNNPTRLPTTRSTLGVKEN